MSYWRAKLRGAIPIGEAARLGDLFAEVVDDIPLHHAARRAAYLPAAPAITKRWIAFKHELMRYHPACDTPTRYVTVDTVVVVPGRVCVDCGAVFISKHRGVGHCQVCVYKGRAGRARQLRASAGPAEGAMAGERAVLHESAVWKERAISRESTESSERADGTESADTEERAVLKEGTED